MRVLVTGAAGSAGGYFLENLVSKKNISKIFALDLEEAFLKNRPWRLPSSVEQVYCNLTDKENTFKVLRHTKPTHIVHLASDPDVKKSFSAPTPIIHNNIMSTVNLFEAVRSLKLECKVLLASTSEVYGEGSSDHALDENVSLSPINPYAVSKSAQDQLASVYWKCYQIPIVITRMFTYINPRRKSLFATSFAYQIAKIERGEQSALSHGNLSSTRTIIDIRDAVEAYWLALIKGTEGEVYNIGSEEPIKVGDVLKKLIRKSSKEIPRHLDSQKLRNTDVEGQIPCVDKFVKETGWRANYSLDESLDLLLQECRKLCEWEQIHSEI